MDNSRGVFETREQDQSSIELSANQQALLTVGLAITLLRRRGHQQLNLFSRSSYEDDALFGTAVAWEINHILCNICAKAEADVESGTILSQIFYFDLCIFSWKSPGGTGPPTNAHVATQPNSTTMNFQEPTKFLQLLTSSLCGNLCRSELETFRNHIKYALRDQNT